MADVLKQRAQELPAPIQMRPSRLRPRDRAAQMGAAAEIGARRSDGATIKPGKLTFEEGLTFGISTALPNPRNMMSMGRVC